MKSYPLLVICVIIIGCSSDNENNRIDRFSLVTRNNVVINAVDTLGSLSVGNGEFAFTVDVTGLQTFPAHYEKGIPLGTQSQWGWHSFLNKNGYKLSDVAKEFGSPVGISAPYAVQHTEGRAGDATNFLRSNPHRLHLGQIGLIITRSNGEEVSIDDLKNIDQNLDLWSGKIESTYEVEGKPIKVTTFAMQEDDGIAAKIESPLLSTGRLMVRLKFPYGKDCHVCPGYDWGNADKHSSELTTESDYLYTITRNLDSTRYYTNVSLNNGQLKQTSPHEFLISSDQNSEWIDIGVVFSRDKKPYDVDFEEVARYNVEHWKNFWMGGGAVDFSDCTDPRARELERRVVLSQYLTKIQCSGSLPPQETGLTMNSWYGKYHLEMYWWHGVHFALWNRASLLERSLEWYEDALQPAQITAKWQGYKGARWQKMTEPQGHESPSNIGAFIIWQQPHPIYMAELLYRETPDQVVLERYRDVVFETADFLASFARKKDDAYHLLRPLIPAQEIFKATETDDPTFELQYWKYGLTVAQAWRQRLGLPDNEEWNSVIEQLAPLPVSDGMYLPTATTPNAYTDDQFRRDHPSVLAALGCLPADERIDKAIMQKTFDNIMNNWQWTETWGWDYPMMAMTAARLGKPEGAIDALMMDAQTNTYLVNGHNFQDKRLRLYLPGNGGLLTAVAMMAAGWDGNEIANPGFPKNGEWEIKWEGLRAMP
jgi:hypothetical protein